MSTSKTAKTFLAALLITFGCDHDPVTPDDEGVSSTSEVVSTGEVEDSSSSTGEPSQPECPACVATGWCGDNGWTCWGVLQGQGGEEFGCCSIQGFACCLPYEAPAQVTG